MDDCDAHLTGRFGHCGQELLNLMLTGRGSSQLHDFEIDHASGMKLRGVFERPQIGLLSQLETYRLVKASTSALFSIYMFIFEEFDSDKQRVCYKSASDNRSIFVRPTQPLNTLC
jgi:hypothetical protein